jgi:hypothetical protein
VGSERQSGSLKLKKSIVEKILGPLFWQAIRGFTRGWQELGGFFFYGCSLKKLAVFNNESIFRHLIVHVQPNFVIELIDDLGYFANFQGVKWEAEGISSTASEGAICERPSLGAQKPFRCAGSSVHIATQKMVTDSTDIVIHTSQRSGLETSEISINRLAYCRNELDTVLVARDVVWFFTKKIVWIRRETEC